MASTIRSQPARSARSAAGFRRAFWALAASAPMRPFSTSLSHCVLTASRALVTASGWVSNSSTVLPACAAIWAMPRPMAPVPTMPIV